MAGRQLNGSTQVASAYGELLKSFDLFNRDALLFKHHRNAVIDSVDPLLVLGDQALTEWCFNNCVVGLGDLSRGNCSIDSSKFLLTEREYRLFTDWAAQNIEKFGIDWHGW